jgi:fatty acid desaturase
MQSHPDAQNPLAIPGLLNLLLLAAAVATAALLLWIASHASLPAVVAAAIAFSFVNNTVFSLMHEAVHATFHPNRLVNETAGRIAAALFPTAFSLQRAFHLSHHRNNRSERERFDYFAPGESRVLKCLQWYCILTGLYWLSAPLFCLIYACTAGVVRWSRLFTAGNRFARQTSAETFLEVLDGVPLRTVRLDVATSVLGQIGLFYLLDLSLAGWAWCYAFFAVNWSSLQYADHAFSTLDKYEGAWNLRVNSLVRFLFLNYHYHLVHHRSPGIPWIYLPRLVRAGDPSRSFWSVYLSMWRGPRPLPQERGDGRAA